MRKVLGWIIIAIIAIWLLKEPGHAAALAHQVVNALTTLATSI